MLFLKLVLFVPILRQDEAAAAPDEIDLFNNQSLNCLEISKDQLKHSPGILRRQFNVQINSTCSDVFKNGPLQHCLQYLKIVLETCTLCTDTQTRSGSGCNFLTADVCKNRPLQCCLQNIQAKGSPQSWDTNVWNVKMFAKTDLCSAACRLSWELRYSHCIQVFKFSNVQMFAKKQTSAMPAEYHGQGPHLSIRILNWILLSDTLWSSYMYFSSHRVISPMNETAELSRLSCQGITESWDTAPLNLNV